MGGQGWVPGIREDPKQDSLQMKICRADLHGALVKVTLASNPNHVGIEGIIALETRPLSRSSPRITKSESSPKRTLASPSRLLIMCSPSLDPASTPNPEREL